MDLHRFLTERLAEDEAEALAVERDVTAEFGHAMSVLSSALAAAGSGYMEYPVLTIDPTRVLAEVAAKRAVLANERAARAACGSAPLSERLAASDGPTAAYWRGQAWVLRHLATVYADHEDYDPSWAVS